MEITKVVKLFIKRGRPITFGNIMYVCSIWSGAVQNDQCMTSKYRESYSKA